MIKSGCTLKITRDSDGKFESKTCIDFPKGWNKLTASSNLDKPNWIGINGSGGVFVLDVDGKDASKNGFISLIERDIDVDSFNTRTYSTPSGIGRHYYFKMEDRLKPLLRSINIVDGVDIPEGVFGGVGYELTLDVEPIYMPDDLFNMLIKSKNDRAVVTKVMKKTIVVVDDDDSDESDDEDETVEAIRSLVSLIKAKDITSYQAWRAAGWAIKNLIKDDLSGYALWDTMSQKDKIGYKKNESHTMRDTWKAFTIEDVKIDTLIALVSNKAGLKRWSKKYSDLFDESIDSERIDLPDCDRYRGCFDMVDTYSFQDFNQEMHLIEYTSMTEAHNALVSKLFRVCVLVDDMVVMKVKNEFGGLSIVTEQRTAKWRPSLFIKFWKKEQDKAPVRVIMTLNEYLKQDASVIPMYRNMSYKFLNHVNEAELLKTGDFYASPRYQAVHQSTVDDDSIFYFLEYLFVVICDSNQIMYNYMEEYLTFISRNPNAKSERAIVLIGGQGTGKSTFVEFLADWFYGNAISMSNLTGMGQLLSDKNGHLTGKKFICVNELASSKDSFYSDNERLKSLITETNVVIRDLYCKARTVEQFTEYVFCSNHLQSLNVEKMDRRFVILKVSDCHRQDNVYWAKLRSQIMNKRCGDAVYTHFFNRTVDVEFKLLQTPMSELKQQLIDSKKTCIEEFIEHLIDTIAAGKLENELTVSGDDNIVSKTELYNYYIDFAQSRRENPTNRKQFTFQLITISNVIEKRTSTLRGFKLKDLALK